MLDCGWFLGVFRAGFSGKVRKMSEEARTRVWVGIIVSSACLQLFLVVLIVAVQDGHYTVGKTAVPIVAGLGLCAGIVLTRRAFQYKELVRSAVQVHDSRGSDLQLLASGLGSKAETDKSDDVNHRD